MRGKVEFKQALRQRVALLKGLPLSELEHLILNIPYTPGFERLVYILKTLGYQIGLVSGGFTRVIEHIKQRFNLVGAVCIGCVGILAVREAVYAPPLLTLRDP